MHCHTLRALLVSSSSALHRRPPLIWIPFLAAFSLSCAAAPPEREAALGHVVAIDAEGNPVDPVTRGAMAEPAFEAYLARILRAADAASDARFGRGEGKETAAAAGCRWCRFPDGTLQPSGPSAGEPCSCHRVRKLLVHVHGGLNDPETSLRSALASVARMADEEDDADWSYPIFVTWPSGFFSTYLEHLVLLRQGIHSWEFGPVTAPLILVTDVLSGLIRTPRNAYYQLTQDSGVGYEVLTGSSLWPPERDAERVYAAARADGSFHLRRGGYRRGFLEQARRFGLYVVSFPVKFLVSSIFLDGMGSGGWEVMQHRMRNTIRRSAEFERGELGDLPVALSLSLRREASGALSRFFSALERHIRSETERAPADTKVCYQLTLVGHSMGASILNEALRLHPHLPVTRIVYMAPACSIEEAEATLVPFLEMPEHSETELYVLTLHPLAEADEMNFDLLVQRGSLLEWIDHWYSTPTNVDQRRLGKWRNAVRALHVFGGEKVRDRFFLKAFGVDGDSLPQRHGEFNECPFWKAAFRDPEGPMTW